MAEVAAHHIVSVESIKFGGGAMKRKTPSELRGEQLKRKNIVEIVGESAAPLLDSFKGMCGIKKLDFPSNPKYKDTRLGDVYQVKKPRMQMLSGKENAKKQDSLPADRNCSTKIIPNTLNLAPSDTTAACGEKAFTISDDTKDDAAQECIAPAAEKLNESTFRSVAELSLGNGRISGETAVDMNKALKGLVAAKLPALLPDSSKWHGHIPAMNSINLCQEVTFSGPEPPLDLTLKTCIRVVSSSSVRGIHRSIMGSTYNGMTHCCMQNGNLDHQEARPFSESLPYSQIYSSKALYSWVYPQSSLPSSVIAAFSLTASEGVEIDFLNNRFLAWEDAFRCLYYMLRKNACNVFYVCTAQFVVMFTSSAGKGEVKSSCHAYISKSTRGLRSLLKEHDVCFSMPLCQSKMEEATMEDLVELSEIEKQNLGQTLRLRSSSDVDGTPKSLLSFDGNQDVHGLYDFMLNYRSLLSTLTGLDVPMLYAPVMFQNASQRIPEIQCKELNKLDHSALSLKGSSSSSYSVEVKDTYLPPWITSNLCVIMGSEGREYEASFTTEPTSAGLNVALQKLEHNSAEAKVDGSSTFVIPGTSVTSEMCSAVLKGLKYCNKMFSASLSRV